MCGIAGALSLNGASIDARAIWEMTQMLEHRGPDDAGVYAHEAIGLGHARLSIIDLAGGGQPMRSMSRSAWIVFNGEIFNYVELGEKLRSQGHRFATKSDTEVILRLYEVYGTDCVHYLNGQWAFAIWDERKKRLFLSRDRLGVRPLFYTQVKDHVLFASEMKALLVHPAMATRAELDLEALRQVFTYWAVIPPRTIFRNVHEVPPGHSLIVENGTLSVRRYWQLDYPPADTLADVSAGDEQRYSNELKELLFDATRIRLRADVSVGAYISGGLDSSIIAALARSVVGPSLSTFSISFEDPTLDESIFQEEMARALGTRHRTVRCNASQVSGVLPDVIWQTEQPILRTAPAPLFLLSRLVRESGFKVVLTGEGSDEFQGGYDIYKEAKIRAFWAAEANSGRRPLLLRKLYPYLPALQKQGQAYVSAFFRVWPGAENDPFFSHRLRWQLGSKMYQFFSRPVRAELQVNDPCADLGPLLPEGFENWSLFPRAEYLEATLLLSGYLLSSQGDRMAMAHSVEARYPFLDHRVVELSTRIPPNLKMKVLQEKYLLKRSVVELVPPSIRNRPKQPYRAPDVSSLFDSTSGLARHAYIEEMLSPQRLHDNGFFDPAAVGKLVEKAQAGRAKSFVDNAALIGILSTQLLVDQFVLNLKEKIIDGTDRARTAPVCGR